MDNDTNQATPSRLHRRSSGRLIGGVAGGLGDYMGVDPVLFRIGFIVLVLVGGSGILLYLLGWLLIPEENQPQPIGLTLLERVRGRRWFVALIVGIAAVFFLDWIQVGDQNWTLLGAVALVAIGFVLLRDEETNPATKERTLPAPDSATQPLESSAPRVKRARSPLGFMTLGVMFVAIALAAGLTGAGAVELDIGQFFALALVVVGIGLVVGAWWGRARLLVVLALFLVPPMILASMVDVPLKGEIGSDYLQPRAGILDEYNILAGGMTLDLSRYRFTETAEEVDISFVAGNVDVYVPPGVSVQVRGEVDLGVADIFGDNYEGRNLAFDDGYSTPGHTEGTLILNIDGGAGSFDTTWARWVEQEKRYQQREEERIENQKARKEARRDDGPRDRN